MLDFENFIPKNLIKNLKFLTRFRFYREFLKLKLRKKTQKYQKLLIFSDGSNIRN